MHMLTRTHEDAQVVSHIPYFTPFGHLPLTITTRLKKSLIFPACNKNYNPSNSSFSIHWIYLLNLYNLSLKCANRNYLIKSFSLPTFRTWHVNFLSLRGKVKRAENPKTPNFCNASPKNSMEALQEHYCSACRMLLPRYPEKYNFSFWVRKHNFKKKSVPCVTLAY